MRFMNPNRKNVETKSFLPAGIRIRDIDQRVLNTEEKYIGIVDEHGEMLGAIQAERLRFIYQWNQTLDMAQILEHRCYSCGQRKPDFLCKSCVFRHFECGPG